MSQDLPDVAGDKKYNISTFASKRGVKFTARAASAVLALNYVSAIVEGALAPGKKRRTQASLVVPEKGG